MWIVLIMVSIVFARHFISLRLTTVCFTKFEAGFNDWYFASFIKSIRLHISLAHILDIVGVIEELHEKAKIKIRTQW